MILVKQDPSIINDEDDCSNTPLHLAALHGHIKVVELLLNQGAAIDARYEGLHTASFFMFKYSLLCSYRLNFCFSSHFSIMSLTSSLSYLPIFFVSIFSASHRYLNTTSDHFFPTTPSSGVFNYLSYHLRYSNFLHIVYNIHLMSAPEENSEFCFPETLNVSRDEVEVASLFVLLYS